MRTNNFDSKKIIRLSEGPNARNAKLTYPLRPSPGAIPTGRFANRPMRKLHRADMAAVEVMRSWRTSATQARYV